ncbi:MAG: hypothetical protein LQ340_002107 [Diploschistes diacapsis]|nr:MAG: hypothetical protein LQ340_002107 [Diploschistes diacapsis]
MASQMSVGHMSQPNVSSGDAETSSMASGKAKTPSRSRANTTGLEPIRIPRNDMDERYESRIGDLDEETDDMGTEVAQSVVGVSIGREQTRLMSPTTPAAEKSAALDHTNSWGFFDDAEDEDEDEDRKEMLRNTLENSLPIPPDFQRGKGDINSTESARRDPNFPTISLPSPWTSTRPLHFVDEDKFKDRRSPKSRSRATSTAGILSDLSIKRLLPTGLGLPSISPRSGQKESAQTITKRAPSPSKRPSRSNTLFARNLSWTGIANSRGRSRSRSREGQQLSPASRNQVSAHRRQISSPLLNYSPRVVEGSKDMAQETSNASTHATWERFVATSPRLTRSASHDSVPHSVLSRISSLGEDGRWENVDEQVNSRLKAIKDTIADSLPSIPSINFGALRPEFATRKDGQILRTMSTVFNTSASRSRANSATSTAPSSPMRKEFVTSRFPLLDEALENLKGDILLLGGYRGSVLRSAEPPHRQLWVPIKVGLNIRKVDLEVGLNPEDEENMEKQIFPSAMLNHIGPIDISRRLFKRLRSCRNYREGTLRVHDYGYDWRLSPELLSRKLLKYVEGLCCNKPGTPPAQRGVTVIAHSLGGLITRHAVNQRPELFAGVLFAGTPQHCVNILGPFRNGDEVLLSSKVLTAQVNFTLRTSFVLLPESGQCFIDKDTKEQYRVDFFNVESWKRYAFSPCIARCLPPASTTERRSILDSITGTIQSFSGSTSTVNTNNGISHPKPVAELATKADELAHPASKTLDMHMGSPPPAASGSTIPLDKALAYLERTLAETLGFKRALAHNPAHQSKNLYPPHAVLYSCSMPTVYGARVAGREGIKRADAYDNLVFASGDGVVLARAAMLPRGYKVVEGGRVRTERGHVGMLSDLEAVGRCLLAIVGGRQEGIGLGSGDAGGDGMAFGQCGEKASRVDSGGVGGGDWVGDGRPF